MTEAQRAFALRQDASGTPVGAITRKMGISDVTSYRSKKLYANLGVAEIRRLKQREEDNRRPEELVADLTLDEQMLRDVLPKKVRDPPFAGNWCGGCKPCTGRVNGRPAGGAHGSHRASDRQGLPPSCNGRRSLECIVS